MNKKWLIGCGGCLGVVLIIAVVLGGLAYWGADSFMKGSSGAAEALFGETPSGYTPMFGMSDDTGEGVSMVMMMSLDSGNLLIGLESPADDEDLEAFKSGNVDKLEPMINKALSSSGEGVDNMNVLGVDTLQTNFASVLALRITTTSSSGKTTPALVTFFPLKNNRLRVAMLMNANTRSSRGNAEFKEDFEFMISDMTEIINETSVAIDSSETKSTEAIPTEG